MNRRRVVVPRPSCTYRSASEKAAELLEVGPGSVALKPSRRDGMRLARHSRHFDFRKGLRTRDATKGERPKERLADFGTLLRRCRKARCMDGHPLKLSEAQTQDVSRLHREFRNEFAHFILKGWPIEKAGLSRIIRAAVDTTEMLMTHPRVIRELSGNSKRQLADRLKVARATYLIRDYARAEGFFYYFFGHV